MYASVSSNSLVIRSDESCVRNRIGWDDEAPLAFIASYAAAALSMISGIIDKVISMAHNAASRAVRQHSSVSLPPMSAYERRLVHIALRDNARVDTHSEGSDPERRVVITLR